MKKFNKLLFISIDTNAEIINANEIIISGFKFFSELVIDELYTAKFNFFKKNGFVYIPHRFESITINDSGFLIDINKIEKIKKQKKFENIKEALNNKKIIKALRELKLKNL